MRFATTKIRLVLIMVMALLTSFTAKSAVTVTEVNLSSEVDTSTSQVMVSWDPSPDSSVTGYFLYYGPDSDSLTNRLEVGSKTQVALKGLVQSEVYVFAVTAHDETGAESEPSNVITYAAPTTAPTLSLENSNSQEKTLVLGFQTVAGGSYRIESSTDLIHWTTVMTTNSVNGGRMSIPMTILTSDTGRFFRTVQE